MIESLTVDIEIWKSGLARKDLDSTLYQKYTRRVLLYRAFTEQLPNRMAKQRKMLISKFKEARKLKKKTRRAVDKKTADYVLYVSKEKI